MIKRWCVKIVRLIWTFFVKKFTLQLTFPKYIQKHARKVVSWNNKINLTVFSGRKVFFDRRIAHGVTIAREPTFAAADKDWEMCISKVVSTTHLLHSHQSFYIYCNFYNICPTLNSHDSDSKTQFTLKNCFISF